MRHPARPLTRMLSCVQILSLDLTSSGLELPRVGQQAPLPAPLRSLAWGSLGVATRQSKVRCAL